MNVLIVDPSRTVTYMLSTLFAKHGFEPRVAKLGREALEILGRWPVDLLCFAYELDDMNGIELFVAARAHKLLHQQPGLMFTSSHDKHLIDQALDAGVTECFQKRYPEQLEQFVENFSASNRQLFEGCVLLVEDSPINALYCRHLLENLGLEVDVSGSAEEAIKLFAGKHYDMVVTDYVLLGMETGFSVIRAVRESAGKKSLTPVLAMSSFDNKARKVEVLRNGANDFITKPVLAEELEVRVSNLLKMHRMMRRLESQHEAMKTLAMHDPLTSLCNRYQLNEVMPSLIADAHAHARPLALMVLDIDHFKQINDTLGHKAGDLVLEQFAQTLQGLCRSDDLVARIGGEEFVAVLPGVGLADAVSRAEKVRVRIMAHIHGGIQVTVSIGVAALAGGEGYDELFHRADGAMYRAKLAGRNCVEMATWGGAEDEKPAQPALSAFKRRRHAQVVR
jgi:two-component system cell cycle response regulator